MPSSNPNIKFSYLYRDAANYKLFGSIIFANPDHLPVKAIESVIQSRLIDGEYFDPKKWNVPVLAFEDYVDALDHDWMEFERLEETSGNSNADFSLKAFLNALSSV